MSGFDTRPIRVYNNEGKRTSQKCLICGKEMFPCGLTKRYCKHSCRKIGQFNIQNGTDYRTLKEIEEHYIKNNIPHRGKIKAKPIMQFRLNGTYVRTVPSTYTAKFIGDENGVFCKNSLARCARGERNTYRGYIWIYKEDYTEELLHKRVELVNKRFKNLEKPVVCLDLEGNLLGKYKSVTQGAESSYVDRTSLQLHLKRALKHNTCVGCLWMYEDDYIQQTS